MGLRGIAIRCGRAFLVLGLCAGTACVESVLTRSETAVPLVCEPEPGEPGRVTGSLSDVETGKPVIGGMVEVWNTDFGANTDEGGQYMIAGVLHPGRYTLITGAIGYEGKRALVRVRSDSTGIVDFRLRPQPIKFKVVDVRGGKH